MPMDFATASVEDAIAGIEKMKISSSKRGKENAGPSAKESLATAQQCLKAAQKRLAQPGEDVAQLAALCQSTLRLMEQHSAATRSTQLHTAAYTTIRALVSAKAYAPALDEALRLHAALDKAHNVAGGAVQPGDLPSDVVNLGVGAALTLALCWAEGAGSGSKELSYVIHAAETAQEWFRLLPSEEAHKHSQTLFKSLYRGAAKMLERQRWEGLPEVCRSMLAAAGTAAGPLALSAACKLAQHAPDPHLISILASVVSGVPSDSSNGDVLKAALTPASLLRKRVATAISGISDPEAILHAVGGSDAALNVAAALEAGAGIVGRGARCSSGSSAAEAFASHSHSAAVSISCAERLRAASVALGGTADWAAGAEAAAAVLGWRWPAWSDARGAQQVLSTQELAWLSSSLFNVGLELRDAAAAATGAGFSALTSSACETLTISLAAALTALIQTSDDEQLPQDTAKRAEALVDALAAAGQGNEAVTAAATAAAAALSARPDFPSSALQTIVSAAVKHLAQAEAPEEGKTQSTRRQASRAASKTTVSSTAAASITAEVQQRAEYLPEDAVAAVARAELAAWAGELAGRGGLPPPPTAEAAAGAAARHLLEAVYPVKTAALDHVRTLLLMHSLGMKAGNDAPLAAAEAVLKPLSKRGEPEAASLAALVAAQRALDEAQALVEAAVAQQAAATEARRRRVQDNPSEVHADDTGNISKDIDSNQAAQEDWARMAAAAADAVEQVAAALESGAGQSTAALLGPCVLELGVICGVHSLEKAEATALEAAAVLGRGADAAALASGTLPYCILPTNISSSSENPAELEAAATELANAGRSPTLLLRRAELCMAASLRHEASGAAIPALHCAGEAHRLLSSLVRSDSATGSSAPAADASDGEGPGWWRLAVAYCRSLALVGRLFECAGMAEEAVSALREGQRMAELMGNGLLGTFFSAQLALLWANSGQNTSAAAAADTVESALDGSASEAVNDSPAGLFIKMLVSCAQTRLQEGTQAALAGHAAVEAAEALAELADADSSISAHAEAALAFAHMSLVENLRSEGRASSEIAAAAAQGLARLGASGLGVFAAGPRSALMLAQDESETGIKRPEKLKTARLWAPRQFSAELGDSDEETAALRWAATPGLWAALAASRGAPHVHRWAAAQLAPAVAAAGCPCLAALLLHAGSGTTLQMQHRLVLHARERAAQRRQEAGVAHDAAAALEVLDSGLDWGLIEGTLAISSHKSEPTSKVTKRGGRRPAAKPAAGVAPGAAAALAALEVQAEQTLDKWLSVLPEGTTVCSVGCRRLAVEAHPTRPQDCLVISRLRSGGAAPVILDIPVEAYGSGGAAQHPIRALALFGDEESDSEASSSAPAAPAAVASAVAEMERLLERSTHSMKKMPTDTKEQQREWWHARVDLDDALAALLAHLDASWLGPWRCLLLGPPAEPAQAEALRRRASSVVTRLAEAAGGKGDVEAPPVVEDLVSAVLHGASGMSTAELRAAAATLCAALGGGPVDASSGLAASAAKILAQAPVEESKTDAPPPETAVKPRKVKFCEDEEADADGAVEASPPQSLRRAVSFIDDSMGDNSTGNLCARFDALAVDKRPPLPSAAGTPGLGLPARTPGAATLRAKKHKSRLGMLQSTAATPAPKSARKPLQPLGDMGGPPTAVAASRVAATAPRPPRPAETPAAARTMPARARPATRTPSGPSGAPVVAVFSPELQSLPWESIPGLAAQRLYRLPALPCAAAAAATRATPAPAVGLSSAYYLINPSGDLQSTQDTFEAWFQGLRGWRGRAGCPPPPAEIAAALQAEQLFVYCGHGGGEQYLPPARLRGMPRCATALLMGCSSGRLRGGSSSGVYEPTGVVLAYLLAGCPAAVANLWDVTDRDIDRYAQAVLTRWLSGASDGSGSGDVAAAAAAARSACKLPCLIGAAPVCYGIPTLVQPPCAA